jgi:Rieske Fe-S protein
MNVDRRRFVEFAAGLLAATAVPGCASVATTRVQPSDGTIRLVVRNFPMLAQPGGYLKIHPEGAATPIYVLALDNGRYAALSPICTHLACTVNIEGPRLVCPCHGSTYDRAGQVLRGPAERALKQFKVVMESEGELVIELEGGA